MRDTWMLAVFSVLNSSLPIWRLVRPSVTRWELASELVADIRQLEQRIAVVEARIKAAVAQVNTSLLGLFGVGAGAGRHLPG
jgi:hypothetical protein